MRMRLLLLPLIAVTAACSSGGGGKSLSTGTYVISNGATQTDACKALGDLTTTDGTTFSVTNVSSTNITFDFPSGPPFSATRSGNTFDASSTLDTDWTNPSTSGLTGSYDCMEHDLFGYSGSITGADRLTISEDIQYTDTTGTGAACIAAVNSAYGTSLSAWPCESKGGFDGSKQ